MAGSKPRYTAAQVCAALTASKGLVYLAAKRLKCDPDTVNNYCKRYPSVQAARDAQRGEMVDLAEQKLFESIKKGEAWGISLCLKTLGRDRGYVERQEFGGDPAAPIVMKVVYENAPYDASIDVTPQHALQDGHGPAQ
jgi:hypothetical protein